MLPTSVHGSGPAGPVVTQDPPRPVRRGPAPRAMPYVRSLAPLVGLSIVVVVLIAGITAWVSSSADPRSVAPTTARPPLATSAPVIVSDAAPSTSPTAARTSRPKAVAPTKATPRTTTPRTSAPAPTSNAAPTSSEPVTDGTGSAEPPPESPPCTGLFGCVGG